MIEEIAQPSNSGMKARNQGDRNAQSTNRLQEGSLVHRGRTTGTEKNGVLNADGNREKMVARRFKRACTLRNNGTSREGSGYGDGMMSVCKRKAVNRVN